MQLKMLEEHLAQCERHVALGERHLSRQREIIAELDRGGHDSTKARELLVIFGETQAIVAHRDRLRDELANAAANGALLDMSLADLAVAAVVPATVIADFETGAWIRPADLDAIQDALKRAGVEFIDGDLGVRLRK